MAYKNREITIKRILVVLLCLLLVSCDTLAPIKTATVVNNNLHVYFIDIGQGDATVIKTENYTMLIDAGTNASSDKLLDKIKTLGITKFDYVIATHPHEDHIGGLDKVIEQFDIGKIFMPNKTTTTKTFSDVLKAMEAKDLTLTIPNPGVPVDGEVFYLGQAECTIIAPNNDSYTDLNSYSIVMRLVYGNTSFLFTGDTDEESEKEMLVRKYPLKSDLLKVGHHGSDTSTSSEYLLAISPKYAVISVGADNNYGHPDKLTLDKLIKMNTKIYRTDLNGTITAITNGNTIEIKSEK